LRGWVDTKLTGEPKPTPIACCEGVASAFAHWAKAVRATAMRRMNCMVVAVEGVENRDRLLCCDVVHKSKRSLNIWLMEKKSVMKIGHVISVEK